MIKQPVIREMSLDDIRPADYNPRKIKTKAKKGLDGSIDYFGLLSLIVWNERSGNIVGGHQRYDYLVEQEETSTPVVVGDWDDEEERVLNIALNNEHLRGSFTEEVKAQLAETEVQIGSVFNEIGLGDLKKSIGDSAKTSSYDNDGGGEPPPDRDYKEVASITCPECNSRWEMKSNKVIYNGNISLED